VFVDYGKLKVLFNDTGTIVTISPKYRSLARPMSFFGSLAFVAGQSESVNGQLFFIAGNRQSDSVLEWRISSMVVKG